MSSSRPKWWSNVKDRYGLFWDLTAAALFIVIVWAPFVIAAIVIYRVVTNV